MSQQSNYGATEVAVAAVAPAAATPGRARGLVLALALCAGGALFAVAGPGPSPRLRGTQLDTFWTTMGGVLSQVETDANGLEHVIATLENGERVPVCSSGTTDSYGNCVDEGCTSWFDGCNTCNVGTDGALGCTRMFCEKENLGEAKCLDATEPDIVGGPTGDAKQDACCGGGSACGWTYCETLDKCVQEWETPCPKAPAAEPGVVNYFDTVAKQANTDCTGGESVGVNCAGGTPLSTEDKFSGSGEDMGEAVPTSTATTVEAANAADKEAPSTKTPIINTAAGPSTQSESDCTGSGCIYTTGGAKSRGTTGAGKGPEGMGVSD